MKKYIFQALAVALCLALLLTGCGGGGSGTGSTTPPNGETNSGGEATGGGIQINDGSESEEIPEGRIGVTYWSTWGADNKAYIQSVIDSFNNSQAVYYVTMQYVGGREDLYSRLQVTEKSKLPALINATTEMTGSFLYSDWITPIYEMATGEDQWYADRVYSNLVGTWGDGNGNLLGYPMGNSMSGIYFNMDVMERAGIDPYTDVKSVEDLYAVCKKLKDGGYTQKYAIGFEHTIRFLNYSLSIEGVDAYNNGNGLTGVPSESYYNTSPVKELCTQYMETFKKIQDEGLCFTMGASWGTELLPAYAQGDIVMLTGTIGGYGRLERAWEDTAASPLNTAFLPWVPVTDNGRATGQPASGNGFYIIDNGNADSQKGAWEFIKFFCTGENFAGWCTLTGYLPIADDILETETYSTYMAQRPNLGLEYLMQVQRDDDGKTFHPVSAVYTETSSIGLDKFNAYLGGADIETVLSEMQSEINDAFTMWNMANGY